MEQGGAYYELRGSTPEEVLSGFVKALSVNTAVPAEYIPAENIPAENLLDAILEREALMSTGIGRGIALPHPRNHLIKLEKDQFVALAYLEDPVDWHSLDGIKVDTLLLIISSSAKQHLQTLSRINYFCRQDNFYKQIKERAPLETLLAYIREEEKKWI